MSIPRELLQLSEEQLAEGLMSADNNHSLLAQTESFSHLAPQGLDICVCKCTEMAHTQTHTQVLAQGNSLLGFGLSVRCCDIYSQSIIL